jgi:phosphoribosylaminoimidazole (AIR) synthetase
MPRHQTAANGQILHRAIGPSWGFFSNGFSCVRETFAQVKVLSPTDAQQNCFKRSIKIYIKTAPKGFGVITIIRKRTI